jgi:hypothetical protein
MSTSHGFTIRSIHQSFWAMFMMFLLLSCAPTNVKKYYYIREQDLPTPSKLNFPIQELIELLVSNRGSLPGHAVLKKNLMFKDIKLEEQYFYNFPEIGGVIDISFSINSISGESPKHDWSFSIQYPSIRPEVLFKPEYLKKIEKPDNAWRVYQVIDGPLQGACVSDYSMSDRKGFYNENDRSIVIFSKRLDGESNCE